MKDITRTWLKEEVNVCHSLWNEHIKNKEELNHFHICDFELLNMIYRGKDNYRKFNKKFEKQCIEYLTSIGEKRDEYMECCDHCPHMRYLTLSEDDYFLNITSLSIDERYEKFLFEKELPPSEV